jgi:hypothetical protein
MITPVTSVTRSLLHVPNLMSICTNTVVLGSDVMNVGSSLFARMHFALTKGFTQASDLISVLCATDLSILHPTFVSMNRYFHKCKYYHVDDMCYEINFQGLQYCMCSVGCL